VKKITDAAAAGPDAEALDGMAWKDRETFQVTMSKFLPGAASKQTHASRRRNLRQKLVSALAPLGWELQPGNRLVFRRK
jgi:hypothetical protein